MQIHVLARVKELPKCSGYENGIYYVKLLVKLCYGTDFDAFQQMLEP